MLLFELENVQEFLRCFGQRQLWVVGDDEGSAGEFFLDIQGEEFTIVGYAVVRDKRRCRDRCGQDQSGGRYCPVRFPGPDPAGVAGRGGAGIRWWCFSGRAS